MDALWFGSEDGAFFDSQNIAKNRKIKYPLLPERLSGKLSNPQQLRIPPKEHGEIRILSADIALMSSAKNNNDATSIFINRMMPTKAGRYMSNFVYTENYEGLRGDAQALIIRKLFQEFQCDYIVLDCQGVGMTVFESLTTDIVDTETGEIYPAISCCNNDEMAKRCTAPNAEKVIWAVKASAQFNSDCAVLLREGFRSGRVRLLTNEYDGEESLKDLKGYNSLNPTEKVMLTMPYVNTTLLVNELTKLEYEENGGKIKIFEKSGMRKDRYSSISYNYYVALQVENKTNRKRAREINSAESFIIKAPNIKYTSKGGGRKNGPNLFSR